MVSSVTITLTQAQTPVEYGYNRSIRIYAPNFKPYNDVEGSPFIPGDSVQNGWLLNSTKRIPARLRYNSYTGEVEYAEGNKIFTPASSVTAFAILAPDTLYFRRGFPTVNSKTAVQFYQVLFDGHKSKLLKYVFATIKSNTEAMSNDFGKKEFQKREEYYVWVANAQPPAENYFEKLADGEMKSVALNKKVLINLFPQHAERIDRYLADKKIKLKAWTELASVLNYVETLSPAPHN